MEASAAPAHQWEEVSEAVLAAIGAKMEPRIRRVSEALYDDLLSTVQDHLSENARFNIASRLDSAERERRLQWGRAEAAEAKAEALRNALAWALPLAERALEECRLSRIRSGHSDIGAERGTDIGLYDNEVEARDIAREILTKASGGAK